MYDEDGNKYIDFVGSEGPMVLGHSNKQIIDAIKKQATRAISFGAQQNELEIAKIIKIISQIMEKIRMVNSGTEATMSCIRLARGYTKKNKDSGDFIGCYHGHVDSLLVKAGSGLATLGIPDSPGIYRRAFKAYSTIPYNDKEALLQPLKSMVRT